MIKDKIIKNIPNFLTSLNLFCGTIATILAIESYNLLLYSSMFIGIAAIFDFTDGLSARILKAYSPMGKELDSIADMVSFGLAPTAVMYQLLRKAQHIATDTTLFQLQFEQLLFFIPVFLIAVFSGIRLAKFNIDTRQTESFIGLATPANAIMIASLPVIRTYQANVLFTEQLLGNKFFFVSYSIIVCYLLISQIPMFSLKFKHLKFKDNHIRYIFLITSAIFIVIFYTIAIPLIILFYILLSLISNLISKVRANRH